MTTTVALHDLTKEFGSFRAVDHVTLDVHSGEIFGFLGANGAGKTTTIRMLCGLLLPTSGSGTVNQFDIYTDTEKIKSSIGYMSQRFSLYPDLTGRENLDFYGTVYRLGRRALKDRIRELEESLDLSSFIDRLTASLPLGWKQRLALSAALLHRPRILFLDEPTAGVDPVFRRRFWDVLYDLADGGTTLFVTTHYMDEATYCSRISVMHAGRIIEVGEPLAIIDTYGKKDLQETFIHLITTQSGERP